ncbi:aminotransferase class V-fold PLP-dependent enzyme [Allomuricauda sp. F6463D]|uniref:aminotransferase class V-fold PLP-dependent enzyme n=1 Tax=Allomuricauda sp. F6463D TaxID=2926409 RepID=UPI001FF113F5|nr:aminotransferase class V-fold PLP-dependent enzyme [Muricauda sp. F6463D]MCK0159113.1 aminotransferase class V-fold PLP-dependent enzyme [Muricauda sp. F6463D]
MSKQEKMTLESYFGSFRKKIIGIDQMIETPFGSKKIIYADWIASGRLYGPIEDIITDKIGPFVGNTHSETTYTGKLMTHLYEEAKDRIKQHVNASNDDVIITTDTGMTGVLCKFQRILGLKVPEKLQKSLAIPEKERPVVFLTHMEHHSNQTTWLETIADVVLLRPTDDLFVDAGQLRMELEKYGDRKLKIGSFTACSNVTGVSTPYYELAEIMHEYKGYCFVDFAASAPYVQIDMHPTQKERKLDAIFFSPHKFLGGPGSSGVLIFDKELYKNRIPDNPGGGTVKWTNPWGEHSFFDSIEAREDGGTPGFLQTIKTALSIGLKDKMSVDKIRQRENELTRKCFEELPKIKGIHVFASEVRYRLGVFSFYVEHLHYNLVVRLLNDHYGIQVRGGCSCAGTYGHILLKVSQERSKYITDQIDHGNLTDKPGWVRLSLHPTMTDRELDFILVALRQIAENGEEMAKEYDYDSLSNTFYHKSESSQGLKLDKLFKL